MAYGHEIGQALIISPPREGLIRVLAVTTTSANTDVTEFAGQEVEVEADGCNVFVVLSRHSLAVASATATSGLTRAFKIPDGQAMRVRLRPGVDNYLAYVTGTGSGYVRIAQSSEEMLRTNVADWSPSDIVGLTGFTGWWRADDVVLTSGVVSQANDKLGGSATLTQGTGANRPTPWTPGTTANQSYAALLFDGTNDHLVGPALSDLIANNLGTIISFFQPTTVATDDADAFANNCIIGDSSAEIALGVRSSGYLIGGNNDGAADSVQIAIASATAVRMGVWRHTGGNLLVRQGSSAGALSEATGSSGNTSDLTGTLYVGRTGSIYFTGRWMETLVFSVSVPQSLLDLIFAYGRRRYGVPDANI